MGELKLKPEVKELWLDRLRSGRDGQCSGKLADGEGNYCCLGVLSEIAVEQMVIAPAEVQTDVDDLGIERCEVRYDGAVATLPAQVAKWAFEGLSEDDMDLNCNWENPFVDGLDLGKSLAELNDWGMTFAQIADVIEEQL